MKSYIRIFAIVLIVVSAACKDWLDVTPAGQASESDMFSTGNGYRSVLNGLYKAMGQKTLYGRNWSYGMLDCMSQMYNLDNAEAFHDEMCKSAEKFDYLNDLVSAEIEAEWGAAYKIIANANNLLQNIVNASDEVFAYGEMERKMIMGEAYACRALIHFDLLRLFAPAPISDDGQTYIPYVDAYPTLSASKLTVSQVLDKVVADLEKARELTITFDSTVDGQGVNASGNARFLNTYTYDYGANIVGQLEDFEPTKLDDFFKGRGYRLNYYACTALLARVYQYAGKYQESFNCAKEVMDAVVTFRSGTTYSIYKDNFDGIANSIWGHTESDFESGSDYKMISNLVFAAYNKLSYEGTGNWLSGDWKSGLNPNWFQISETFFNYKGTDESTSDHRWNHLMYYGGGSFPVSGKWFIPSDANKRNANVNIFPVIRSTEMRYIMAEYYARNNNMSEAYSILNKIREDRGIYGSSLTGSTWSDFQSDLLHDARREWLSEGQLFFLYKRLNAAFVEDRGQVRQMTLQESMFPVPADIK